MQAFNNSILLIPYVVVVNAAGWFRLLSNGMLSSSPSLQPAWNDWKASANSLTEIYLYGSSLFAQYWCWSFLDVTYSCIEMTVSSYGSIHKQKNPCKRLEKDFHVQSQKMFHSSSTLTSCKKSAAPFLSGHLKPIASKNCRTFSRGPW